MVNRDYTREVGLRSDEKLVSKPVAAVLLVVLAIGGFFAVRTMSSGSTHQPITAPTPEPAKSAVAVR
jgi:hypothetical protein